MGLRELPLRSFDVGLRAALWPLDRVARSARRAGASTSSPELALDHADAALRGLAGWVLRDSGLRSDGLRRLQDVCQRASLLQRRRPTHLETDRTDELGARRRQKHRPTGTTA